jgi:hypothetical protein
MFPRSLCAIETEAGLYLGGIDAVKTPAAHLFDNPHRAELFIRDTRDTGLRIVSVPNLEQWLETLIAAGINWVDEHTAMECISHQPSRWLVELMGGAKEFGPR